MPPHPIVAAITAALDGLNATGANASREDLEPMVLAMIELVAHSTIDADSDFARILR
jgi:hypothetical protein